MTHENLLIFVSKQTGEVAERTVNLRKKLYNPGAWGVKSFKIRKRGRKLVKSKQMFNKIH